MAAGASGRLVYPVIKTTLKGITVSGKLWADLKDMRRQCVPPSIALCDRRVQRKGEGRKDRRGTGGQGTGNSMSQRGNPCVRGGMDMSGMWELKRRTRSPPWDSSSGQIAVSTAKRREKGSWV